jgi:peptidoglycan hydrolase CwlO-like protein
MKKLLLATVLSFVALFLFFNFSKSLAQSINCDNTSSLDLDQINICLDNLSKAKSDSEKATKPLEDQINSIVARVNFIERDLVAKEKSIDDGYKNLERQQEILNTTIRDYYIKSYYNSPLLIFLSTNSASELTQVLGYQRATADRDKALITNLVLSITTLEERKKALEAEKANIVVVKEKLAKVVTEAKAYQADLSGKIAALSARQQQIINERSGGFTASIGNSELADDYNASIKGFRESAPSGYFAAFSFGAHTHRKGMSQYGARGRAQSGQTYKQILQAYYGKEPVSKDTGGDINVTGYGSMNFEEKYLYGIAEMPSSWNMEALKAQAVAARTYAYRYKTQGTSICTTEACQVYNDSKANNPPDAWKQAVQSTKGEVLEDVVTYYASTHGGYASPIGWDTTDGSGGSNFIDKAWDKAGGSPWLYKAWYTQGYSSSSDKCGRSNPWLSPQEMADIVNAAIALRTGGIDTSRITPVTTSCWGGNPYSMDELRNLVAGNGGISSATSVSVSQGDGTTNTVTINGISFSGAEFKKAFNLRAPARLSIPQSGFAFFNIEKK